MPIEHLIPPDSRVEIDAKIADARGQRNLVERYIFEGHVQMPLGAGSAGRLHRSLPTAIGTRRR